MHVAAFVFRAQPHPAGAYGIIHVADDQTLAKLGGPRVAKGDDLGKVVPGVDVQQREGKFPGTERLFGEPQHHDGILAAGEQQGRIAALRRDFAQDMNGF